MQTESSIIEAVNSGDTEKFSWLIQRYSTKIFALAKSLLNNQEDAEEVTQDVFVKAFKSLDKFRGDSKFSSFLYRICYNECMTRIRTRKIEFDVETIAIADEEIQDGYFQLKIEEQKRFLNLALKKLHPDYSMILTLFYLEEQSYSEIVETTEMSLSNVKVKLHRAKNALAKVMNELLKDELKSLI